MSRTVNTIGTRIAQELDQAGKPGSVHMLATFDAYYPGYIDYMPMYQHIASWWTETQGGNCGIPRTSTVDQLPADYRALLPTSMYNSPWKEGRWTLKDQVDYMVTASIATLRYAAKFREELLYNRYQSGRDAIAMHRASGPYAWIVPQRQRDPVAPVEMLRRLAFLGVRVMQLRQRRRRTTGRHVSGRHVGRAARPGVRAARARTARAAEVSGHGRRPAVRRRRLDAAVPDERQRDRGKDSAVGGVPRRDDGRSRASPKPWGASDQYPFTTNAMAAGIVPPPSSITGRGSALALDPAQNNTFRLINRALAGGATLRLRARHGDARRALPAGRARTRSALDSMAKALWVSGERMNVRAERHRLPPCRHASRSTRPAPATWTRAGPSGCSTRTASSTRSSDPTDIRDGNLGARFDVILMASQGLTSAGRGGGRGGAGGGGAPGGRGGGAPAR